MTQHSSEAVLGEFNSKVLIAEDDSTSRRLLSAILTKAGFVVVEAKDGVEAMQKFTKDVAVGVFDLDMPRASGLECMKFLHRTYPELPIVFVSSGSINDAVRVMKEGAYWFASKPIDSNEIAEIVGQALLVSQRLEEKDFNETTSALLVGQSEAIGRVRADVNKLIDIDSTLLVTGETGTGKSALARHLHLSSNRKDNPFVTVSCSVLPQELLENELFGSPDENGDSGKIKMAKGGVLFLDEVGDLPLGLQPRVLDFLENQLSKADVRVIATTSKDLEQLTSEGKFRSDLLLRLKVLHIAMPSLNKRLDDLPDLIGVLLNRISDRRSGAHFKVTEEAVRALRSYEWPGNIRELENVLERTSAFANSSVIDLPDLLVSDDQKPVDSSSKSLIIGGLPLEEVERRAIIETLELTGGNKAEAARRLQISERSIYNKLKRLKIEA